MSNDGRRWFEQTKEFVGRTRDGVIDTPDLYTRCPGCGEMLFNEALAHVGQVCGKCGYHLRIEAEPRLVAFCDAGSIEPHDAHLRAVDALSFVDSKPYDKRLVASIKSAGRNDAFVSASATLDGLPIEIGCFDFRFMGGSMGSVVGEMVTRLIERAAERGRPAIVISASGGARMQEGVLSLMQMAKTAAALAKLKDEAKMPYISILTHPTTGGVAASFSMLGDVILAEPGALIGFAGPRVIQQTIGQELPEGFQTSEYLLAHGMVDAIVARGEMRAKVSSLLRLMLGQPAARRDGQRATRSQLAVDLEKPAHGPTA